jgi:NAD(P)-dependent dehydrogenase (short-subunit alcohol dehydrogenase family)
VSGRLAGRRALVAGTDGAIGRAIVEAFELEGAAVIDEGDLAGADHLDALVVATALIDWWPLEEDGVDRWDDVVRATLIEPARLAERCVPLLAHGTEPSITFLGSIDGLRGNPRVPAYSVAKGGVHALTRTLAGALGARGIRVNCIATGGIRQHPEDAVPLQRATADPVLQLAATPLGRKATPGDVAGVAVFFASSDAAYVTGAVLPVDGGRTAVTPGTLVT